MTATKIWRLSSTRFGPAKPRTLKCARSSCVSQNARARMPSSSCSPIRSSTIWRRVGAPWTSPWKKDSTPSRRSVSWKCRQPMPPAITAFPHRGTPSRNYCAVPTSSSQRLSPSLVHACPRRKNSNQNGLFSKFRYLTGFWRFGLGGKMGWRSYDRSHRAPAPSHSLPLTVNSRRRSRRTPACHALEDGLAMRPKGGVKLPGAHASGGINEHIAHMRLVRQRVEHAVLVDELGLRIAQHREVQAQLGRHRHRQG